jgi:hypothetical protein
MPGDQEHEMEVSHVLGVCEGFSKHKVQINKRKAIAGNSAGKVMCNGGTSTVECEAARKNMYD